MCKWILWCRNIWQPPEYTIPYVPAIWKVLRCNPHYISMLPNAHESSVPINYYLPQQPRWHHISQSIIPSTHKIPPFKSVPTISANIFDGDSFPKDDTSIDVSGDRVEDYANPVMASGSIQKLQRLISFCNDGTFQFQPAVNLTATTSLHV